MSFGFSRASFCISNLLIKTIIYQRIINKTKKVFIFAANFKPLIIMATKKIDFLLSPEIVGNATSGMLLGDFNNWNYENGIVMKKQKDGSLKASVALETGKSYQYRFLLSDSRWVNDKNADSYVKVPLFNAENCVINVPATAKRTTTAKASTAKKTKTTTATTATKPAAKKAVVKTTTTKATTAKSAAPKTAATKKVATASADKTPAKATGTRAKKA